MTIFKNVSPIIKIFWGLILYNTCGLLGMYISSVNYVKVVTVVYMLFVFFAATKNNRTDSSSTLIRVFLLYTSFILLRGTLIGNLPLNGGRQETDLFGIIRYTLIYEHSAIAFFLIFCLMIPFDYREMRFYRPMAYICTILCAINIFFFRFDLFSFNTFGRTSIILNGDTLPIRHLIRYSFIGLGSILLFCYNLKNFMRSWYDYIPLVIVVLYGGAQVAGGGRGGTVTSLVYIIFLLYFFTKSTDSKGMMSGSSYGLRLVVVAFVIYGAYYFLFKTDFTEFLFSRMFVSGEAGGDFVENNRQEFMNAMLDNFNEHPLAWVVGKGVNGSYIYHGNPRDTIEWGFMYLILKGGIIYLALYIIILLKAFYLGFFKSNNYLCKAMAVLCMICVYTLIPFGLPMVSLEFVIVWHYVRLLNTNSIRNMSDAEIKAMINNKLVRVKKQDECTLDN